MRYLILILSFIILFNHHAFAKPYWDQPSVPKDTISADTHLSLANLKPVSSDSAVDVLRIQIDWEEGEIYKISKTILESSGTPALLKRSTKKPALGSYLGILKDKMGNTVYFDSIGTGKEYRKFTRAITFRFPVPTEYMEFELFAENPQSGVMEKVLSQPILLNQLEKQQTQVHADVREISHAKRLPEIRVNLYAEGYLQNEQKDFWLHATKTVTALQRKKFPGVEHMSFYGVFHPSNKKLETQQNLGLPIPEYDSFLGLYYPYWHGVGRWFHVVYPTREDKFRHGLASAPYDYAIVLVNNPFYWGVGNYMALTAIPAANVANFSYLLFHEFGHYFGLNEEYEGGGPTDLEFATDIDEPWSQNITLLVDKHYDNLKWKDFVNAAIELPTPYTKWHSQPPVYGAYRGGYGDSPSTKGLSHTPGLNCIMGSGSEFCHICKQAIEQVVESG